jgi:hypothetical protein
MFESCRAHFAVPAAERGSPDTCGVRWASIRLATQDALSAALCRWAEVACSNHAGRTRTTIARTPATPSTTRSGVTGTRNREYASWPPETTIR